MSETEERMGDAYREYSRLVEILDAPMPEERKDILDAVQYAVNRGFGGELDFEGIVRITLQVASNAGWVGPTDLAAAVKAERGRWLTVLEAMNEHAYASDPELTRLICIKSILTMALPAARGEEYAQKALDAQIAEAAAIRARGEE